nr:MAG TPA: hypothetical protein [Bacteriophage sp.]
MPSPFSLRVCYFGYAGCRFTLRVLSITDRTLIFVFVIYCAYGHNRLLK